MENTKEYNLKVFGKVKLIVWKMIIKEKEFYKSKDMDESISDDDGEFYTEKIYNSIILDEPEDYDELYYVNFKDSCFRTIFDFAYDEIINWNMANVNIKLKDTFSFKTWLEVEKVLIKYW